MTGPRRRAAPSLEASSAALMSAARAALGRITHESSCEVYQNHPRLRNATGISLGPCKLNDSSRTKPSSSKSKWLCWAPEPHSSPSIRSKKHERSLARQLGPVKAANDGVRRAVPLRTACAKGLSTPCNVEKKPAGSRVVVAASPWPQPAPLLCTRASSENRSDREGHDAPPVTRLALLVCPAIGRCSSSRSMKSAFSTHSESSLPLPVCPAKEGLVTAEIGSYCRSMLRSCSLGLQ
mmetsp:Transcript_3196/g.10719  ORF Transcript_3196/g.10719 Transcript_3196/m.10719 type:complete len:237 (-) Transcript_3196:1052-1762(-)